MKKIIVCLAALFAAFSASAQFDGAVGTDSCQAISLSDPRIQSWAFGVEVQRGFQQNSTTAFASYGKPYMAQGLPDGTTTTAVALGEGGTALITFLNPIVDGEGADFCVFENGFNATYLELGFVEVSSDGENFYRFPSTSLITSNGSINPELINNLAGKYQVGWGTPFDLAELENAEYLDKTNIRFVRIVDVVGGVDTDAQGNIIYDAQSGGPATGFDLTGVGVINQANAYQVADCEGLLTNADSHELISASNGTMDSEGNYRLDYASGGLVFEALGLYGGSFACGFGPSNHTTNQASYSSQSLNGLEGEGNTYMVGYYSDYIGTQEHNVVRKQDQSTFYPMGVYVNNSSAAYNYMSTANFTQSNYYLNIIATGYDANGTMTNSVVTSLGGSQGLVSEWKYMDLSSLGECSKIIFSLSSNDDSGYGMNVPAYFCIDALTYRDEIEQTITLPTVNTLAATEITDGSATLNATITAGSEEILEQGFFYKASTETEWIKEIVNGENISLSIENLEAEFEYEYKAFAITESDTVEGEILSFSTLAGLEDIESESLIASLYPNPANDFATISLSKPAKDAKIILSDMQGRIILSDKISNETYELNLHNMQSGVYYIKIIYKNNVSTQKLIVK